MILVIQYDPMVLNNKLISEYGEKKVKRLFWSGPAARAFFAEIEKILNSKNKPVMGSVRSVSQHGASTPLNCAVC